ncbi:MAG: FecR domain-containing protein [Rikenellaceae bacterium]|nr:FecR domain-containing protein [Rikenellaceae bacterium]MCL2693087.1 FecR domain-containing protein [Rikenellaceae bacterium]
MKLKEEKYLNYSVEQFLLDDFFLKSILSPTAEADSLWTEAATKNKENFEQAKEFVLALRSENLRVSDERIAALQDRISESIGQKKRSKRLSIYIGAASAAVAVFIILLATIRKETEHDATGDVVKFREMAMVEMSDRIQLVLSENKVEFYGNRAAIDYSSDDGIRINEEVYTQASKRMEFNQLLVPFGKQSSVTLSDGSKIWVNAGTRMVYPEMFADDRREIYVIGEIYGDIAHDSDRPFIIKTPRITVEVLGTKLNVSDYESDEGMSVILVEGAVKLRHDGDRQLQLKPNEMFYSSPRGNGVKTVDAHRLVSWKDGYIHFASERLEDILKDVAKYYGVEIVCMQGAGDVRCSGDLYLSEDFERVLEGICGVASVEFRFENGKYIITKK